MKKALIAIFILFCSVAAFAKTDLQIALEGLSVVYPNSVGAGLKLTNHTYFGDKQMVGIGESIGIGFGTDGNRPAGLVFKLLVGPAFCINVSESLKFQWITGLRYIYGYSNLATNEIDYSGYSMRYSNTLISLLWGNDLQLKFSANRFCSFVIGGVISSGFGVDTSIGHAIAIELAPYVAFSMNFGN